MRVPDKIAEEDQSLAALIRVASALRKMGLNEAADIVEVLHPPISPFLHPFSCSLSKTAPRYPVAMSIVHPTTSIFGSTATTTATTTTEKLFLVW